MTPFDHWREYITGKGVLGMSEADWMRVEPDVSKETRAIIRHVMAGLKRQTEWVQERQHETRGEADRILAIGETMRRAGLRSYTDEKGRIFVAGDT